MSDQRIGKYACLEIERKYLLDRLPVDLHEQAPHWQITDHYLVNTRLRLRRMTRVASDQVLYKLGQKYRTDTQAQTQATMTNLYLTAAEYQCLATLEAKQIVKKRYDYVYQGRTYGIDLFGEQLTGLILAEIECATMAEVDGLSLPAFARQDVTDDPFFGGGSLAAIDRATLQAALQARLCAPGMLYESTWSSTALA